ncbi:hypothetical protein KEU06_17340 [Pseudaminobacter sp. 19-2017]|uniref:Uncharacterized protein n=1 Tax=Pseudaminobacter soli (ex Zhang et al. 2022) TaxID=2831468 RepID=A0A942E8J5_9HYPH|nr:hypothetical protein [Pseudaminobacter soli]MBS3650382.1 hypothetical protein [Pseudaminobacter soli]
MPVSNIARLCAAAAVVLFAFGAGALTASAEEATSAEIESLRGALAKYKDPYVAVRDLYLSTVGCVHYDGSKMEGHMEYPKGGMGVHFVNLTVQGPPDPTKPNVLIYEPVDGKLQLVAAEWLMPLAAAKERPKLFGQEFQGPMEGHEPLIPQGFHHYDLHAWVFKDNPNGMFSPTHPDVTCKDYEFSLLEMPTKMVDGH